MPPAAKKDIAIILFDMATTTKFRQEAQNALMDIAWDKYFSSSKDLSKLILFNTEKTANQLNSKKPSQFEHIFETSHFTVYNPMKMHQSIETSKPAHGQWLEALLVGLANCEEADDDRGLITLQVFLFSDFSFATTVNSSNMTKIDSILAKFQSNLYLYILGPEVTAPQLLSTAAEIAHWSKTCQLTGDFAHNEDAIRAKNLLQKAKGIVCNVALGKDLFLSYKNPKAAAKWNEPLAIGTQINVPTSTSRMVKAAQVLKIRTDEEETTTRQWKWVKKDNVEEEVDYAEVVQGIAKYGKFVAMDAGVTNQFKCREPKSFKVVGFTQVDKVPEIFWIGPSPYKMEPNPVVHGSKDFLQALASVLLRKRLCIIARRLYANNNNPKFFVLYAQAGRSHFLMHELPYKNQIMVMPCETAPDPLPSGVDPAFVTAMYQYLDEMRAGGGETGAPLSPAFRPNLLNATVYKRCGQKRLEGTINMEDDSLRAQLVPEWQRVGASEETLTNVLKFVEEVKEKEPTLKKARQMDPVDI